MIKLKIEKYGIAAVAAAAIVLAVTLLLPLGFDNDLYESMGWALYAYHGLPYIGSWDHNFPGIVFIHWLSIALFSASDFGFRFFDYLVHIAMAALYYKVLRHWLSSLASFIGVILYSLYYVSGLWGLAGQRDTYVGFLMLGALQLFLSLRNANTSNIVRPLFIGIFCGVAFLLRPTYVFFALSFLVLLWLPARSAKNMVWYLIGCILPIIAFQTPYLFLPKGLEQVYDTIIRFNLDVYVGVSIPINLVSNGRMPIYLFAAIGLFVAILKKGYESRDRILLLLLGASAIISPVLMGKYFSYHLEPLLILIIGFAAFGFVSLIGRIPMSIARTAVTTMGIGIFIYFYYPRQLLRYYWEERATASPVEATYERVLSDPLFGLEKQNEVIHYVNARVPRDAPIEYISIFPGLRWRMHRPAPTRFTSIVPLSAYRKTVPAYAAAWREEFIDTLIYSPAKLLIVSNSQEWWPFVGKTNDSAIRSIPKFDSLLSSNYLLDTTIGGYAIYRPQK